ncbi:MAG: NUDIX domain-containing protein [Candidatus Promineifilaceae bacterium]
MPASGPRRSETRPERVVWQGDAWQLKAVATRLADGRLVEKGLVDHPGSAVIVPLAAGRVLALRQYRLSLEQTIFELPAGTRRPGESWLACAGRELREETGYRAAEWAELGFIWPSPGLSNEVMALFLARRLTPAPLPADPDEAISLAWLGLGELARQALNGRLADAKSALAVLRAAAALRRPERITWSKGMEADNG